jgi:hypothetical protein
VRDLVRRVPGHTPEWTNLREGDPGRTLIDLFAWLADTILYRANLIPERQRLAFLRLLGAGLRPAAPARGLIALAIDDRAASAPFTLPAGAAVEKPVPFTALTEVTVHAVTGLCVIKRRPTPEEARALADVLPDLQELYGLDRRPQGYVTTPVFAEGAARGGRDIAAETVDGSLWIALLAPTSAPEHREAVRAELGGGAENRRRVLNVGLAPVPDPPGPLEEIGPGRRIPHVWEITTPRGDRVPLDVVADGSRALRDAGVIRLLLPGADDIGAPSNDVLADHRAGVGDRPPRLDDDDAAARLVCWLRMTPDPALRLTSLRLAWAGINAVGIEQRRAFGRRVLGQGTGASDLELPLGAASVEPASLRVEVEEEEGLRPWRRVADVAAAGPGERVYALDAEAGTIAFGSGLRGMVPAAGRAIHAAGFRAGGGAAGNLPAGAIQAVEAPAGAPRLKVLQPLPTTGGVEAETLAEAERRLPALLRNAERAVTAADYRALALATPGGRIGRVEVLERFDPNERGATAPGAVSVMAIPARAGLEPPAPRADRPTLEAVHDWLDARRPLATQLFVVGVDYVPVGVSAAVELVSAENREAVLDAVEQAIRLHLWPLAPGGPDGGGWPLGRALDDREIETAIGRVPGVRAVAPARLFVRDPAAGDAWRGVGEDATGRARLPLRRWQLPELAMLAVAEGDTASTTLPPLVETRDGAVAVPVVPEVC